MIQGLVFGQIASDDIVIGWNNPRTKLIVSPLDKGERRFVWRALIGILEKFDPYGAFGEVVKDSRSYYEQADWLINRGTYILNLNQLRKKLGSYPFLKR